MNKLLLILTLATTSLAHAQINFNQITYRGTGCPQGTVSTAVSPDGSTLSILFDEMRAEVPQYNDNKPTLSHKNCSLSFTANLPQGQRADTLEVSLDARGAVIFDQGVEGVFASILVGYNGLAQSKGRPTIIAQKHWRALRGPVDDEYVASPRAQVNLNSGCAARGASSIRFDLKNHVQAEIPSGDTRRNGILTIDSADLKGMLRFTLRTRPCAGGRTTPGPR